MKPHPAVSLTLAIVAAIGAGVAWVWRRGQGRECVWRGWGVQADFDDPGNWADGVVPKPGDVMVFESKPDTRNADI